MCMATIVGVQTADPDSGRFRDAALVRNTREGLQLMSKLFDSQSLYNMVSAGKAKAKLEKELKACMEKIENIKKLKKYG